MLPAIFLNGRRASADTVPDRIVPRQIKRRNLERDPHASAAYRCVYRNGISLSRVTEGSNDGSTLADTVSSRNVSPQIKRDVLERGPHPAVAYRRVYSSGSSVRRVTDA